MYSVWLAPTLVSVLLTLLLLLLGPEAAVCLGMSSSPACSRGTTMLSSLSVAAERGSSSRALVEVTIALQHGTTPWHDKARVHFYDPVAVHMVARCACTYGGKA